MTQLTGRERAHYVQSMFTKIAHRYDLMNRLMTGGQDIRWRKEVVQLARLSPNASLLDLGTGTGDLAREALTQVPQARVTAADFTLEMMRVGKQNGDLNFSSADALNLPFKDKTFDAIVSGFLMRNVTDVQQALKEQHRTLKPGGRIVVLDTTRPKQNLLTPFIKFHMHVIIPTVGGLLSGMRDAYEYLPDTTEGFLTAEELSVRMVSVGFRKVNFKRLMFGTIAIHWGEK
jgi:demethylmenaquinone methyltransferase/2-methoxy-6-polyprenyl-1,4-benzoquinol methylase